ncbi:MAG: UDP-glucose 4-epimerase GalE [Firmicutes bacterium HGW-Firmicutes-19]|jgi:UDP-glucose 4-epimerase|nr:MAG: UDP-glucose 4-epimerase GalE [Firmicutes bacterium HGW-Firmicutes-19]
MKVCVIGGAGYIGSHAVLELVEDGHDVVVIDNLSTGTKDAVDSQARFYLGDITSESQLNEIFAKESAIAPFDAVMHFAAKIVVPESVSHPLEYYHNNVEGVRIMLKTMVNHGIKNVIFSSTAAVYGDVKKDICTEDDELKPINPYGESKLASERMIHWVAQAYDMNYCVFRYFNVAGAHESLKIGLKRDNLTHIIPITVQTALKLRESMVVFGDDYPTLDGTCIRDYIHVADLAYAHVLGMKYIVNENKSVTINLGSSTGYSVKQVIDEVSIHFPVKYSIGPRREGDPAKLIASSERAKKLLGWTPKRTLKDIIKTDLDFRIKHETHK